MQAPSLRASRKSFGKFCPGRAAVPKRHVGSPCSRINPVPRNANQNHLATAVEPPRMKARPSVSMKHLIIACWCSLMSCALHSHAAVYVVHGIEWDITTYNTTWQSSAADLATQPWWGSSQLARDFATAVGTTLGGQLPGSSVNPADGPFFAYGAPTSQGPVGAKYNSSSGTIILTGFISQPFLNMTYAQAIPRGGSQQFPILPTIPTFLRGPSGRWFDPPAATGFEFTMTEGSLFTSIINFPVGIDGDNLFQVWVNDEIFGVYSTGQSVDFGAGVSSFRITGIDPSVDGGDPMAFPIQLGFNTPEAAFTMVPIPEPSSVLLVAVSGALFLRRRRRACV